jgi:hypothetical protein
MPDFHYREHGDAAAPIEVVFATVSDHESYANWSTCDESFLEREGTPQRNGLGAVRVLRDLTSLDVPIDVKEIINHYWPPYLLGYRVLDQSIVRDHQGIVLLEKIDDDHTRLTWHMTASAADPSMVDALRGDLGVGVRHLVGNVCAEAERRAKH